MEYQIATSNCSFHSKIALVGVLLNGLVIVGVRSNRSTWQTRSSWQRWWIQHRCKKNENLFLAWKWWRNQLPFISAVYDTRKLNTSINHLLLWLCAASLLEATFGILAKSLILGNGNVSPCHYVDRYSIVRVTCGTLWAFGCFTLFSENTKYIKRHIWHQSMLSDHHNRK